MIQISCKTILGGNGNILNSRQKLFSSLPFWGPSLYEGTLFGMHICGEFILVKGLHSILPPALQIPLERRDSKKNLKFHAKYRIQNTEYCAKPLVRIFVIRNSALRKQNRNWHFSMYKYKENCNAICHICICN